MKDKILHSDTKHNTKNVSIKIIENVFAVKCYIKKQWSPITFVGINVRQYTYLWGKQKHRVLTKKYTIFTYGCLIRGQ